MMEEVQLQLGIEPLRLSLHSPAVERPSPAASSQPHTTVHLLSRSGRKFELTPAGRSWLSSLPSKLRVAVVCGPPASGKTAMMNDLCGEARFDSEERNGKSPSEGVWATLAFDCVILGTVYSDTKGFAGSDQLPAVLLIISSLVIFNSVGAIDKKAVAQLSVFAQARNWIYTETPCSDLYQFCAQIRPMAPEIVWTLRDFTMGLQGSAKEYMENVLRMAEPSPDFSNCKDLLYHLFTSRDCVIFPDRELAASEYDSSLQSLQTAVSLSRPKLFYDFAITGPVLVSILEKVLKRLNDRRQVSLKEVYEEIVDEKYEELLALLKKTYLQQKEIEVAEMPYEETQLTFRLMRAKSRTLEIVSTSHLTNPSLLRDTMDEFTHFTLENESFTYAANATASYAYNFRLLEKIFLPLMTSGYDTDIDWIHASREYEEKAIGPARLKALVEFMESHPFPGDIEKLSSLVERLRNELQNALDRDKKIAKKLQKLQQKQSISRSDEGLRELIVALGRKVKVQLPEDSDSLTYLENIYIQLRSREEDAPTANPQREPKPPPHDSGPQIKVTRSPVTPKRKPPGREVHCQCVLS